MYTRLKPVKISIVIPTFNRADLIDQTLQSVAKQTTKPYEVIVVDNASTDNTAEIVSKYKRFGIKYVVNPTNLGMVGNYNMCAKLATGDYLSFLHSDDLIAPNWHEAFSKAILTQQADFYSSSMCVIDSANNPSFIYHTYPDNRLLTSSETLPSLLHHYCPLLAPVGATVFNRKKLLSCGKFDEQLGTEADADISLKIILTSSLFYVHEVLFAHRRHALQTFDLTKEVKSDSMKLNKLETYFHLVRDYSDEELISSPYRRLFILTHLFMSLCSINLYLVLFQFSKVIDSNKLALKLFPDLFRRPLDWYLFLKIQFMFIFRTLFNRFQFASDRRQLHWLKSIIVTNSSPN